MGLTKDQTTLLAKGLAGANTQSGAMVVRGTRPVATPQETYQKPSGGILNKLVDTSYAVAAFSKAIVGGVTKSVFDIPGEAYRTATETVPTVFGFGHNSTLRDLTKESDKLSKEADNIFSDYASNRITKDEYQQRINDLSVRRKDHNQRSRDELSSIDPVKAAVEFADTAFFAWTLGASSLVSVGSKEAFAVSSKVIPESVVGLFKFAGNAIESSLKRLPGNYFEKIFAKSGISVVEGLGNLAVRDTIDGAEQLVGKIGAEYAKNVSKLSLTTTVAKKLFLKYPLTYNVMVGDTSEIVKNISEKDFKGAGGILLLDSMYAAGGIWSAGKELSQKFGKSFTSAVFGKSSVIDELSLFTKDASRGAIGDFINGLKVTDRPRYNRAMEWLRSFEAMNLHATNGSPKTAATIIKDYLEKEGLSVAKMTGKEVFENIEAFGSTLQKVQADLRLGIVAGVDYAKNASVTLGRWDSTTRNAFTEVIGTASTRQEALNLLEGAVQKQVAWTHNSTLYAKIKNIIATIDDTIVTKIRKIPKQFEGVAKKASEYKNFGDFRKYMVNKNAKVKEQFIKDVWDMAHPKESEISRIIREIKAIDSQVAIGSGWSVETKAAFKKYGYVPILPKRIMNRYISPEKAGQITSDFIQGALATEKPLPGLEAVGNLLTKSGLSLEDSTKMSNILMKENLVSSLEKIQIPTEVGVSKGAEVINKLRDYMESLPRYIGKKLPAQDARTLTTKEIQKALSVDKTVAKEVQKSILDAYTSIPLSVRGLGDKLVDYAFALNPLQRAYARIQGALRYSWNPFFRFQEEVETETFSQLLAGGKAPSAHGVNKIIDLFFKQESKKVNEAVKILDRQGVFKGTLGGEAAQEVVIGRITANITNTQKRSLAGLALKLAEQKGVKLDRLLAKEPDVITDALRTIVQYPKSGAINSPAARTLNLAFFPMRYNIKVAGMTVNALAKASPAVQLAVTNGVLDARKWFASDEGIAWQSKHQDGIRILKWATPYNSIESVLELLNGSRPDSIAKLGMLGGLPFGIITQMIDSQTTFNLNRPYIDLKTGKVFPDYIPQTTKARAAQAIQDLLTSMFTYPGRIVGLPGKSAILRSGIQSKLGVDTKQFEIRVREDTELTKTQKNQIRVIKGLEQSSDVSKYKFVYDGYTWNDNGYFIPVSVRNKLEGVTPRKEPVGIPIPTRVDIAKNKRAKKKKTKKRTIARPIQPR